MKVSFKPTPIESLGKQGFTLTEMGIVLGIIGLILGAVWAAASSVHASMNIQKAAEEFQFILNGYRSLYANNQLDPLDWTDVTCLGVNAGLFPSSMLQQGVACVTSDGTTYPSAPWGSAKSGQYVRVYTYKTWGGFTILFPTPSVSTCFAFLTAVATPDAIWESTSTTSNGLGTPLGAGLWTPSIINTNGYCNGSTYVAVMYPAK